MTGARLVVRAAGPHCTVQDAGRPGMGRFGVPASGPMDRIAFAAANRALGNPAGAAGIEVSAGGLTVDCVAGRVGFAVAGGGFVVDQDGRRGGSWMTGVLAAGSTLAIRAGPWGSWTYLALAGRLVVPRWLGSAATHAPSGLGGGRLSAGDRLEIEDAGPGPVAPGPITVSLHARPRPVLRVVMGPQERFFEPGSRALLVEATWRQTEARDRMGVRLSGPPIAPAAALDMPSEPVARGSVQVAGDGVATVLMADHQTTGGYPKIATALDCDLDGFAQLRPRDRFVFRAVTPAEAVAAARLRAAGLAAYLAALSRGGAGR
jgi:allophanate hydrolase